jgi:uncharacterized phiE125 gp8 family phage protein
MLYDPSYNFSWPRLIDSRYHLEIIEGPAVEPVNAAFLMAQCRVDDPDESGDIVALGKAARRVFEKSCHGLVLVNTTFQISYDGFNCNGLDIPVRPVREIVSIKYDDMAGTEQTLDPSLYQLDKKTVSARVFPKYGKTWPLTLPQANAVRITFTAGMADPEDADDSDELDLIPSEIKLAIGQWASTNYENRESVLVGKTPFRLPHAYDAIVAMHDAPRL